MKWKEFFKLTKQKIFLTIIFGIFTGYQTILRFVFPSEYPDILKFVFNASPPLSNILNAIGYIQSIFLFPPLILYAFVLDFFRMLLNATTSSLWFLSPILWLFMILWWYFISSLIFWIYVKAKKKK